MTGVTSFGYPPGDGPSSMATVEIGGVWVRHPDGDSRVRLREGWKTGIGPVLSTFRQRCWLRHDDDRRPDVVLVTELADNEGLSVTNAIETIYRFVVVRHPNCVVVEHYDRASWDGRTGPETFALVTLDPEGPQWHHMTPAHFAALVGGS